MINYLLFIAIAVIVFVVFRGLRLISHRIKAIVRFYPFLVTLELVIWITFLFWIIQYFFEFKSYYNELILVLVVTSVILLVWLYIKDVVAGFLFRIKHNPSVGQLLQSDDVNGVIKKMAPSQMFVEREGGEIRRIPYSRLMVKSLSIRSEDARSASEVILQLEYKDNMDRIELERGIRQTLLQSPWCVANKPIKINFLVSPEHGIEITLHLLDKSFAEAAKKKLTTLSVE